MLLLTVLLIQGPPPDSLTLAEAMARSRAARGQIVVASARVAAARAAFRVAGEVPNPTLSYSHSESPPRQHLLVDQPLGWLLRRGLDRESARYGIRSALADSSAAVADQERQVRVAFYTARGTQVAETLAIAQSALADSVARIGAARLRAGDISLLESERADAEAARVRQTLSMAREVSRVAASDLAGVIGADPAHPPMAVGALDANLDHPPSRAVAVEEVPAVRAAIADSVSAAALARSTRVGNVPLPTLQAGAEWQDPTTPKAGALAVIGLSIPLPVWQHGSGAAAEARARALVAAAGVREARLEVARRAEEARIRLEESGLRARFARDSLLPAARSLRRRALKAYQKGETGVLPVLDALRSERDASVAGTEDMVAFQTALAEWNALLGGGR